MKRFSATKLFKVAVIAAIFGLLVFWNPFSVFQPLRSGVLFVVHPFQKAVYSFSAGLGGMRDFLVSIGQLKTENENLMKEKQQLLSDNAELSDLKKENEELRRQFEMLPRDKFQFQAATVVSQDPNGLGNWIEIDKGSNDGIQEGMTVVVSKGILVGKIQKVDAKTSQVILLTNPKSTTNVMTSETGARGVVKGEYGLGIIFDMILQTDVVSVGDDVITSGIGGIVPRGLYVGKVQEVHPSDDHLFQQAIVISPLQISKMQFVFVVKKSL